MTGFFDNLALGIGRLWSLLCNPLIVLGFLACLGIDIFFQYRIYHDALPVMGLAASGRGLDRNGRESVLKLLGHCDRWRSLSAAFIALFPQAGILGTVSALLLELSQSGGVSTGSVNLRFAMTSTLYGLLAALVLKIADIILARGLERVQKELEPEEKKEEAEVR
ncbi:MAG: MotA/TolQ/ExbB proton channel family protein [Oscillospiraceae bacterium]|nr:MotA/TolQ/ExbB proton channel family protein [Oscillospiraceae bacterium]